MYIRIKVLLGRRGFVTVRAFGLTRSQQGRARCQAVRDEFAIYIIDIDTDIDICICMCIHILVLFGRRGFVTIPL